MKKIGLGFKIMAFTFFILFVSAGVLIYFSYKTSYLDLENAIGQRLEAIAATGAIMINGDLHDQIKTPEDAESQAFRSIQKILREIKKKNNLMEEIYTFRQEGDILKFIVMSHEKPFIGDTYQIREEMWAALNQGKSCHTKIYKDAHGIWLSAYGPIFDSNGQISGILDVDVHLETFKKELAIKVRRLGIISIILMTTAILVSFILSRRLVKNLRYLRDITEKISTGLLDRSIDIKTQDEIGELAESLERMRTSVKMALNMLKEKEE